MQGISKRFGNFAALCDVSLKLRRGTVHALLGENGAGKTTLMRIAFGLLHPDKGSIRIDGVSRSMRSPADAIAAGGGMVHQHFMLVPAMTVTENVELGGHGRFDSQSSAEKLQLLEEQIGVMLDLSARAGTLGVAAQQRLEIIKALARVGWTGFYRDRYRSARTLASGWCRHCCGRLRCCECTPVPV